VGDGWSTAAIEAEWSEDMFYECTSLVGGSGTAYDANYVDAAYAHIDGGPSNPGYFTSEPEAYAVYDNATLTFYCDNLRNTRGTTYSLNEGEDEPNWLTDETYTSVTHVVFDSSFANAHPTTCYCWFYGMENLTSITGMEYLNTANVTNMGGMFSFCTSLTSINVSHFNTANVTNMAGMFYGCAGLTSLDLSSFNTAHVFGMHYMFYGCTGLTRLDLSSFNTANVQSMEGMFDDCSNLTTIYVGDGWSTDGVDTTDRMFYGCTSLVGGNGTVYDTNHVNAAYAHIDGGQSNPGYFTEKPSFIPGDANGDRAVSVADAVAVVAYLLNPSAANINLDAADVDGVEGVTIGDVQAIVNMILNKTE
jgi:surface protein